MHIYYHVLLQAGGSMQLTSPWHRELVAMQQHVAKIQHEDEDQGATINESMDLLMRMRSQAQSSAAVSASPGHPGDDVSGSYSENVPEENSPSQLPMDERDTVCFGDACGESDVPPAVAPHLHVRHAKQQDGITSSDGQQCSSIVHADDSNGTAVANTAAALLPSGVFRRPLQMRQALPLKTCYVDLEMHLLPLPDCKSIDGKFWHCSGCNLASRQKKQLFCVLSQLVESIEVYERRWSDGVFSFE
jgi:hypothetical protein